MIQPLPMRWLETLRRLHLLLEGMGAVRTAGTTTAIIGMNGAMIDVVTILAAMAVAMGIAMEADLVLPVLLTCNKTISSLKLLGSLCLLMIDQQGLVRDLEANSLTVRVMHVQCTRLAK